jgi:hypothetical protein
MEVGVLAKETVWMIAQEKYIARLRIQIVRSSYFLVLATKPLSYPGVGIGIALPEV